MRINYQSSIEDLVNVHLRIMARSKTLRRSQRLGGIGAGLLIGLLGGFVVYYACSFLRAPHDARLKGAVVAGAIITIIFPWLNARNIKDQVRKYVREQLATDQDFDVEVELLPEWLSVRQLGYRFLAGWELVEEIYEAPKFLDIRIRRGGLVSVPKSAFESEEMMRRFIEEAQRYIDEANQKPVVV